MFHCNVAGGRWSSHLPGHHTTSPVSGTDTEKKHLKSPSKPRRGWRHQWRPLRYLTGTRSRAAGGGRGGDVAVRKGARRWHSGVPSSTRRAFWGLWRCHVQKPPGGIYRKRGSRRAGDIPRSKSDLYVYYNHKLLNYVYIKNTLLSNRTKPGIQNDTKSEITFFCCIIYFYLIKVVTICVHFLFVACEVR